MPVWSEVVEESDHPSWSSIDSSSILKKLTPCDTNYSSICLKIPYEPEDVFLVQNPKLYAKFLLKKEQYDSSTIRELYHDTEIHNIDSIMESNLDWRRVTRSKYGRGVSFAVTPEYAYHHSNGFNSNKAMIIADVLIGNMATHSSNFPKENIDTSVSADQKVIVKYCDDEFYPKYIIHYVGPQKHRKQRSFFQF